MDDLRVALRSLRRTPASTGLILVVLGLGIGAAATVFALVDALLLRDLPYHDADRLVAVFRVERDGTEPRNPTSPADFIDWRNERGTFETVVAARVWTPTLTGGGEPERLNALLATPELFELLGVPAALGRTFAQTSARSEGANQVVLGHALWQRRFGGERDIIGRTITLDDVPYVVAAVMPPDFRFPPFWATDAELWVPLVFSPADAANRGASYLRVFARLAPGVSIERAQAAMDRLARTLATLHPATNAGVGVNVEALREPSVAGSRTALLVIAAAVALTLLIAATNAGSVMLVRVLARRRDNAIRIALGAGRVRLARAWLSESLLLALGGAVIGLTFALWAVRLLNLFSPAALPGFRIIAIDVRVVAFVTLLTIVVGLGFGAGPALRATRHDVSRSLQGRKAAPLGQRTRDLMVAAQLALASAVLMIAALLASGFIHLSRLDPGFRTRDVVTAQFGFAGDRYGQRASQSLLLDAILERIERTPGIAAAGVVNHLPVAGDFWRTGYVVEGGAYEVDGEETASYRVATGGYFAALGIPIVNGRTFDARDREGQSNVVIINRTLARRAFGTAEAVGRRLAMGRGEDHGPWLEVIGVAGDAVQEDVASPIVPEFFLPYAQNPAAWFRSATIVARGEGGVALERVMREAVLAADPRLPVERARTMQDVLTAKLSDRRFSLLVIGASATGAVLLAVIGLYSVVAQLARMRSRELAIRMAVGASRAEIVRLVMAHATRVVGAGLATGLILCLGALGVATRVAPLPPQPLPAFAASLLLLALCAFAASVMPALRAGRVSLIRILRDD